MNPLDQAEEAIARLVDRVADRVGHFFGGSGFDHRTFPRLVVKQVGRQIESIGGESFCPHRIQVFASPEVDERLGGLRDALVESIEQHVTAWAKREGCRLMKPARVDWLVTPLDDDEDVVVTVSFGSPESQASVRRGIEGPTRPQGAWRTDPEPPGEVEEAPWAQLQGPAGVFFIVGSPVLGRNADADLIVDDSTVSRRHARLRRDARGLCYVEDLGSANGTRINGQRVGALGRLNEGDKLALGHAEFIVGLLAIEP